MRENTGTNQGCSRGNGWIQRNFTRNYRNTFRSMSYYPRFTRGGQGCKACVKGLKELGSHFVAVVETCEEKKKESVYLFFID